MRPRVQSWVRLFSAFCGSVTNGQMYFGFFSRFTTISWNMDVDVVVARTRFDQQHAVLAVFRQAIGNGAARGAGADDDEIELMFSLKGGRVH